ncbi:hypothetical protein [Rhizobium rhizogenes]|uniref:hypothetical protein n=1 Tax=Rhizobium rhizogenes TaxID=359 RepID=UPI0022BD3CAF|nr:hypothetical protein [Rhizobium rhizogenes]MCZ7480539.1 hypothetical protein [Rhizobium rhizogenes]
MKAKKSKPTEKKTESSFATWKFTLENTVSSDPLADGSCLQIVRSYLDFMNVPGDTPYRSLIDLQVDTSLSENTITQKRRKLEELGYFVEAGKTSDGATRYRIVNARENIVLDHKTIMRETLRRLDAEKKEKFRLKRRNHNLSPSEIEGHMSPSKSEVLKGSVPLRNCGDSPSEFEGNYVDNYAESYSYEERDNLYRASSSFKPSHYGLKSDDENTPLPIPADDTEAETMMDAICDGRDVPLVLRNRLKSMLSGGVLTPRMANNILGPRQEVAA